MNLSHLHLLLNHFPTIGMVVGLVLFLAAIAVKSDDLKRASLTTFFAIALLAIPTFVTGTAAQLALSDTPDISKSLVIQHENVAFIALCAMELTGALAWLGLWQFRRRGLIPSTTLAAILILGLATFGLMAQAASIGGEIRHPEIRSAPLVEPATPQPTFARTLGAAMTDIYWTWPISETLHFIGLCLSFGVVLVVDLRMLGFLRAISFDALHRLLPWGVVGFAINVATGMLFFVGAPASFYVTSEVFFWKLALILILGANALYFTVFEEPWRLAPNDAPPFSAKVAAASGILLWVGVIFCGQMLPFLGRSF
jgi:uncharacterized membrane protein